MKIIVDEAGEIIAKATDDHTLIGGHHRLAVAASLGKRLFWRAIARRLILPTQGTRHRFPMISSIVIEVTLTRLTGPQCLMELRKLRRMRLGFDGGTFC